MNSAAAILIFRPLDRGKHMSDVSNNTYTHDSSENTTSKKSKFSPTCKGILVGAVAGSILPVFGTISGAIIGGIAGKVYEKKYSKTHS